MADSRDIQNEVRSYRARRGWSQDELARRAGLSRAGVSAIETDQLVPSTAAALALAEALECRVEDLFHLVGTASSAPSWAWEPSAEPRRYWHAEVSGRTWRYPAGPDLIEPGPQDGTSSSDLCPDGPFGDPRRTLVLAGCDPAVGLLASAYQAQSGFRLLALTRSSSAALDLLARGLVHVAGLHLAGVEEAGGNASWARERLSQGFELLRIASWEEGIAFAPGRAPSTTHFLSDKPLRWVGREPGSGARRCLDLVLGTRRPPRRFARDHRGVAEAIRCGWADAGICLRSISEEAGLTFRTVRREAYDLCIPKPLGDDPRVRALVQVVRSVEYRGWLAGLPGYDTGEAGQTEAFPARDG